MGTPGVTVPRGWTWTHLARVDHGRWVVLEPSQEASAFDGLSVDDVARELGVPPGTVRARLSRGRAALAALIGSTDLEVSRD
jgi:hypothetical protein